MSVTGRVTLTGTISTAEIFSMGFAFRDQNAVSLTAAASALNTMVNGIIGPGLNSRIPPIVIFTRARYQEFDLADGSLLDTVDAPLNQPGTATVGALPWQCSMVVSLRTGVATRRGRGRFYLPPFAIDTVTNGVWIASVVTGVLNNIAGAFNTYTDPALGRSVGLLAKADDALDGLIYRQVTSIDIGSVPDTQRRRRNRAVETRQIAPIA